MLTVYGPGRGLQRLSRTLSGISRNVACKHLSAKVGAKETSTENGRHSSSTASSNIEPVQLQEEANNIVPDIGFGSKVNKGKGDAVRPLYIPEVESPGEIDLEPPTTCCGTGCPNCVWLEYAEALTKVVCKPDVSKDKIKKALDDIQDQNIKAFVMMELRTRGLL